MDVKGFSETGILLHMKSMSEGIAGVQNGVVEECALLSRRKGKRPTDMWIFFLDVFGHRSQWPTSNVLKAGDDVGYYYFRLCAANSIS